MRFKKKSQMARIWRGRTRRELADEYEDYNYREGIVPLRDRLDPTSRD